MMIIPMLSNFTGAEGGFRRHEPDHPQIPAMGAQPAYA